MRIRDKIPAAKRAIEFISRHEDASLAVREEILAELKRFIDQEIADAKADEPRASAIRAQRAAAVQQRYARAVAEAKAAEQTILDAQG